MAYMTDQEKDESMELPPGKNCGMCRWFERCKMLFNCKPQWERCDFFPNRFMEKPPAQAHG